MVTTWTHEGSEEDIWITRETSVVKSLPEGLYLENARETKANPNGSSDTRQVTVLAHLLLQRDWKGAEARSKGPYSHETSEMSVVSDGHGSFCSCLPLHIVCSIRPLPPATLVEAIVEAFPEACRSPHPNGGLLPLHMVANLGYTDTEGGCGLEEVAAENHQQIVQLLIDMYPEAIYAKEHLLGRLPLHIAAATANCENGMVSETSAAVIDLLMETAPQVKQVLDHQERSPVEIAWDKTTFQCHQCGNSGNTACSCKNVVSADVHLLHPLLAEDITKVASSKRSDESPYETKTTKQWETKGTNHSKRETQPKEEIDVPQSDDLYEQRQWNSWRGNSHHHGVLAEDKHSADSDILKDVCTATPSKGNQGRSRARSLLCIVGMHETPEEKGDETREDDGQGRRVRYNSFWNMNRHVSSPCSASKSEFIQFSIPVLRIQVRLTDLKKPQNSKGPRRAPNPFFEVYVTDGKMVATRYQSYPIMGVREATWDEALIELTPLEHKMKKNRTAMEQQNTNWQIGIRVLHCQRRGGQSAQVIGTCRSSLDKLSKEPRQPILDGFQVMGWLEVLSVAVE